MKGKIDKDGIIRRGLSNPSSGYTWLNGEIA